MDFLTPVIIVGIVVFSSWYVASVIGYEKGRKETEEFYNRLINERSKNEIKNESSQN